MMMAACVAMLSACAASRGIERPAADPIVEVRTERVVRCPDAVTAPIPPRIATPSAALDASVEVLRWIGERFAREEALERRLRDAQGECPR
jgi:hypothetical protein